MRKLKVWLIWSIVFVLGFKAMEGLGILVPKSIGSRMLECIVCCFAAWIVTKFKGWRILVIIYLIISLILNFNIVGVYSFIMAITLMVVTSKTEKQ